MNAEIFAEWLRQQGHKVMQTASSYWYNRGPRVYQAFPYHWVIEPNEDELSSLLQTQKAVALRYSTPFTASIGKVSYHVMYEADDYRLEYLPKKARYDVRKGLENARVEPIALSRMVSEGWQLRLDTLTRQGRVGSESQVWWQNLCSSAERLPGFEAWGILKNNELVASLITFTCADCCLILYQQSRTDQLASRVNNALTYVFTKEVILRPEVNRIFYGLHSLDAPASVDKFKFRMRYKAKPVLQHILIHPSLAPLFGRFTYSLTSWARKQRFSRPQLDKAEGLLRFYLEGQQPLSEQSWPEVLQEKNAALMRWHKANINK